MSLPAVRSFQVWNINSDFDETKAYRSLAIAKSMGATFVRSEVGLNMIAGDTPTSPRNWERFDRHIFEIRKRGLGLIMILSGNVFNKAGWNSYTSNFTIRTQEDFEEHAKLYMDIIARALTFLGPDKLIVNIGNEDANHVFGANDFDSYLMTVSGMTGSGVAVEVTTTDPHNLVVGDQVVISGAQGNTASNGVWTVTVVGSSTTFETAAVGNGTYTSGAQVRARAKVPAWRHEFYTILVASIRSLYPYLPIALSQYFLLNADEALWDLNAQNLDFDEYPYLAQIDIFSLSVYLDHSSHPFPTGDQIYQWTAHHLKRAQEIFDSITEGTIKEGFQLGIMETGLHYKEAGLRDNVNDTTSPSAGSASRWDIGSHAEQLGQARYFAALALIANQCVVPGIGVGLVNLYCAMHDVEKYDLRSSQYHYGMANYDGQVYPSVPYLAALYGIEFDLENPDQVGPEGVSPEPSD